MTDRYKRPAPLPMAATVAVETSGPTPGMMIVAVANKLARIVWAVLFREQAYWFADATAEA